MDVWLCDAIGSWQALLRALREAAHEAEAGLVEDPPVIADPVTGWHHYAELEERDNPDIDYAEAA